MGGVLLNARDDSHGEGANGTGFLFEGRFYWASGQEVRADALGDLIAQDVLFQDTTTDLRGITGLDPDTTLAALLPSLNGSPGGLRWTLVSVDQGRGTNPTAYDDTSAVLLGPPSVQP